MTYREYQKKAIARALEFIKDLKNKKKGVIVSPTGSGKSWIIAGIADAITTPILILQPSKELLEQNYEKYTSLGNKASIYSASLNSKEVGHVTFATIQSIKNNVMLFRNLGVKTVIIDECHIGAGSGNMLGKFLTNLGVVKVIGLTATPVVLLSSLEGVMLKMLNRTRKSFFNEILHVTQIKEVIDSGYWANLKYEKIQLDETELEFNVSRSEYTESSMEEVYDYNDVEGKVCDRVEELRKERKHILIFCPSVAKAHELSAKIQGSAVVWGNMPSKERKRVIDSFKSGEIQIVINVNVLAIGFDFEALDTVIDTVPTASIARYYQKLGRACRIHTSKKDALIVDYSGNFNRFGELKNITFEEDKAWGWQMFSGERMLTNVCLDAPPVYKTGAIQTPSEVRFDFGRHNGKLVSEVPIDYLNWMLKEFTWGRNNMHIKQEILRLKGV